MWCQDFTRIEEKSGVHDLNMSSDSMSRGVWNGRANGSFKSNSSSYTHRLSFWTSIHCAHKYVVPRFHSDRGETEGEDTTYICQVTHPHVGSKTAGQKAVSSWFRYCKHIVCLFRTSDHWTCKHVVPRFHLDRREMGVTRPEYVKWLDVTWVWNGRANGSFKSNSWSQTHRLPF